MSVKKLKHIQTKLINRIKSKTITNKREDNPLFASSTHFE